VQVDLEKLELVDLDQVDADEQGAIAPRAAGLAAEMRRGWRASVAEAAEAQLAEHEVELRASMQARRLPRICWMRVASTTACGLAACAVQPATMSLWTSHAAHMLTNALQELSTTGLAA
jgi:hypothetical protein